MSSLRVRLVFAIGIMLAVSLSTVHAQQSGTKTHTFKGTIEKVDAKAKVLTVNGETVEGWMGAMTMNYALDKPEMVDKLKAGDRITAKVYDGDYKTLHEVQVVAANDKKDKK